MALLAKMKAATNTHAQEHDHHHHQAIPSEVALRVKALESLLVEKGLVDPAALDALPERPVGSEKLSEEALAALVTRDAMIGVAKVILPQPGGSP